MEYLRYAIFFLWGALGYYLYSKAQRCAYRDIINAIVCTIAAVGCFYFVLDSLIDSFIVAVGIFLLGEPKEYLARKGITPQKIIHRIENKISRNR